MVSGMLRDITNAKGRVFINIPFLRYCLTLEKKEYVRQVSIAT
jgi:hypothetical protein